MVPLLIWFVVSLGLAQAWMRGSDGRAQWDYECCFEGLELLSLESEPSSRCAELCLAEESCSHWTWTSEGGGTCELKQGATNGVLPHAKYLCGYLPTRFAPDGSKAFDLGLHLPEKREENDFITDKEVETALRMLNSFRTKRGKSKLTLDARLILSAKEFATTCRDVPFTTSMELGEGYEFFPSLPPSLPPRGFNGEMHAVSVAAPLDSSVKHAIEWWTSAVDPKTGTKPFFLNDVAVAGLAKSTDNSCKSSTINSPASIVWTLLLAKSD
ncbi:hypothetical protein P3T76_011140 [Phytophthora citrophthora]|uniref:SCP domain-containing protein n=1 Tax=Phytophthora citrophthora TaxID=4793 RepID=A0AAD9G9W1_9STRA|nr:hypothetical protein P3T76_011140 [Phytophthora citrophthora]